MHLGKLWVFHTCIMGADVTLRHNMKQRSWVCQIPDSPDFCARLVHSNLVCIWTWREKWAIRQLHVCIFRERPGTCSWFQQFLCGYFEWPAVYLWDRNVRDTVRRSIFERVLHCTVILFFSFFFWGFCLYGAVSSKRGGVCIPSYFHRYWLSSICLKLAIRLLKSILFSGVASQHFLIRLYNCQNTKIIIRDAWPGAQLIH